jgi:exodeoxyribonuclease V beta subunit
MSAPAELDWRRLALTGTTLIEASAGTGKTWNIALLYLRLVLERELDARQIVVTTFTEAAAQELRARVRGRLADAEAALAAPALPLDELHDYLAGLVERSGRMPLLNRVRLALAEIDLAPITTIHGLCRRILSDFPFDTGMPFALGEIVDTPKLVRECVEDFWRARFLGDEVDPWEAAYALGQGVAGLAAVVRNILGVDEDAIDLEPTSALRAWWASFCARDLAQMRARVQSGAGFARVNTSVLLRLLRSLLEAAASGDPAGVDWDKLQHHLDPDKVRNAWLKDHTPHLSTWPTVRLLVESRELFARIPARVRHEVALDCARFVRSEIRRRLLQRGQASFSQLIDEVHARLAGAAGDQLAARLQQSWPVALIDEFQDTDARQWAIFDRVWRGAGPGGRALLLIGDPKQSIYGFRGGDVAQLSQRARRAATAADLVDQPQLPLASAPAAGAERALRPRRHRRLRRQRDRLCRGGNRRSGALARHRDPPAAAPAPDAGAIPAQGRPRPDRAGGLRR